MSLTLCIVRKDLYRLRWWLVAWVGLLLIPILLGVQIVLGDVAPMPTWRLWEDLATYLSVLRCLVVYLMVVLMVHEDGLVGGKQFWMTRPISGRRLLMAKAGTAIGLLVVLPIVICVPWWWWCGFTMENMATAAIEVAGLPVLVGVLAAFVAVLTDSISRTLLWTLVLIAVPMTVAALTVMWTRSGADDSRFFLLRMFVAAAIAFLFAGAAVIVQHVTRDRRRVLVVAAIATVVAALTEFSMTVRPLWWTGPSEPAQVHPEKAMDVAVSFSTAYRREGTSSRSRARLDPIDIVFHATGVTLQQWLSGGRADHLWEWDNLRVPQIWWLRVKAGPQTLFGLSSFDQHADPETDEWRLEQAHRRGAMYIPPVRPENWRVNSYPSLRPSVAERMTVEPPRYRGRLWFVLSTPTLEFEMPLRAGERRFGAGHSFRLVRVNGTGDPSFQAIETRPFVMMRFLGEALNRVLWWPDVPEAGYVLLNRKNGEFAGFRGVFGLSAAGESPTIPIYGVGINPRGPVAFGRPVIRDGKIVQLPGWLESTTLAFATMKQESVFYREVQVDKLPVRNQPTQQDE